MFDDAVRGRIEISNSELDDLIIRPDGSPNLQLLCGDDGYGYYPRCTW